MIQYLPTSWIAPPTKKKKINKSTGIFLAHQHQRIICKGFADQEVFYLPGTVGKGLATWRLPRTMEELRPALALG